MATQENTIMDKETDEAIHDALTEAYAAGIEQHRLMVVSSITKALVNPDLDSLSATMVLKVLLASLKPLEKE